MEEKDQTTSHMRPERQGKIKRSIPIAYGNMALWLGKKAEEKKYSHKWIVYVRGINNEDISCFIEKVVFILHASFDNPVREVTTYPFELKEVGWGQFEIGIKIYVKEMSQPIEFFHFLRVTSHLYQALPFPTECPAVD